MIACNDPVDVPTVRSKLVQKAPTPAARAIVAGWPDSMSGVELRARTLAVLEVLSSGSR